MENISIEELKNDVKRLINEKLNSQFCTPTSADILNYASAIAELEKNELVKKFVDVSNTPFSGFNGSEAQIQKVEQDACT